MPENLDNWFFVNITLYALLTSQNSLSASFRLTPLLLIVYTIIQYSRELSTIKSVYTIHIYRAYAHTHIQYRACNTQTRTAGPPYVVVIYRIYTKFGTRWHTLHTVFSTTDALNILPGKAVPTYFHQFCNNSHNSNILLYCVYCAYICVNAYSGAYICSARTVLTILYIVF